MLHELLLALVGCTGDVFVDVGQQDEGDRANPSAEANEEESRCSRIGECTFRLAPDLTFIQHSEREILERLLHLGFYYRELDRFSVRCRNLGWITSPYRNLEDDSSDLKSKKKLACVYLRALGNGIAEVLAVYRSAVLKLEQNFLSDPAPVLASVTQNLKKFEVLLAPLHALIQEVDHKNLRGGRLLDLLHTNCHCGVPEVQSCMQRLLWHGHQVMYRQLAAWMVYGLLQDQHDEFFIGRLHEGGKYAEADATIERPGTANGNLDADLADWHTGFYVVLDMLPEYISIQVAESILFVGKAVRILRNPSKSFKSQGRGYAREEMKDFTMPQGELLRISCAKTSFSNVIDKQELLPQSQVERIAAMIQALKEMPDFHKRSFECAVDSIRTIAATHLWQLVVVHADLIGHLKALKDYFLLAKGDFFQCFLEESRALMRLPPRPSTAEADLKVPFQQAAVKTIGDDDKYFSRVSFKMPSLGSVSLQSENLRPRTRADGSGSLPSTIYGDNANQFNDGWDGIALEYSIDWPLQLLFTRDILSKYCRVFQYLLRLKRIQLELEKSWAEAMQQDRADSTKQRKDPVNGIMARQRQQQRMPMWRIRQHMTYLITNLQFYIQVDVIESQWTLLQERVEASKDFTELVRFHQEYLAALISQSFLDIGSVSRILDNIIKLCLRLCRLIELQDGTPNAVDLEQISEEFNKKSNSLYTILRSSKLAGSQRAPFLRQFLLRLNYNSFFEATARGALNAIRPRSLATAL